MARGVLRSRAMDFNSADAKAVALALLRNLLASERGLIEAYLRADRSHPRQAQLVARGVRAHQNHARWLAEWLRRNGGDVPEQPDDLWIVDASLLDAESTSHDSWHDALLDLPTDLARYVREHLLQDHHVLVRDWEDLLAESVEPSVTA